MKKAGENPAFLRLKSIHFFLRLVNAGNRIKASGVANVREALADYPNKEVLVIAKVPIAFGMGGKLGLAAALRRQKAKSDHFSLCQS